MPLKPLMIVVPLYKQPELLPDLFGSLIAIADEIARLDGTILVINDSPDHAPLATALGERMPALAAATRATLHVNPENLGFVRSCNFAMARAKAMGADVVLLNSDALLTPGALTEMAEVARLDPMISVVSPRSNNATICNSPYPESYRKLALAEAHAAHLAIQHRLPRLTYVPTAVGFCLFIRHLMIEEFGDFDLVYGAGYNEENDFILRCNRRGYRAVLANHAFVFHLGSVSFAVSSASSESREETNAKLLHARYPEYPRSIARYFGGVDFKTQELLAGLVPQDGRIRLLFDCRNIGPYFNGTFEHAKILMTHFVRKYSDRFDCYISCNHDALVFHEFDKISSLKFCWNAEHQMRPFGVVMRCGQPFDHDTLVDIGQLAPVVGYLMLDTIAMDCLHLDDQDLRSLWLDFVDTTSMIGYNSQFTASQFNLRFNVPDDVVQFVSLCSTDVWDYAVAGARDPAEAAPEPYMLLVGNHFPHKNVDATVARLRKITQRPKVVVLGLDIPEGDGIIGYPSGALDNDFVEALYRHAAVLLFPTYYEGFGLPIIHALAHRVPVITRDVPLFHEIRDATPYGANIHLYESTDAMIAAAIRGVGWTDRKQAAVSQTWAKAATALADGITAAMARVDYNVLSRRLRRLENRRLLADAHRRGGHGAASALRPGEISGPGTPGDPLAEFHVLAVAAQRSQSMGDRLIRRVGGASLEIAPGSPCPTDRTFARVTVTVLAMCDFPVLATTCLDAADILAADGALNIALHTEGLIGEDIALMLDRARVALLNAGCYPTRVRRAPGGSTVESVKIRRWSEAVPDAADDAEFVGQIYLSVLHQQPDAAAIKTYVRALQDGSMARGDVVRSLLTTTQRYDAIARHYVSSVRLKAQSQPLRSIAEADQQIDWLKNVTLLLAKTPWWWALMPAGWRRRRQGDRLQARGLFNSEIYLARNPDVARSSMEPFEHYIKYGMAEGRLHQ